MSGLTFLTPLFFAGLAALAVPVIVHLTQRRSRDAVPFPSLMFLDQIPHRAVRRRRIRNWVLFLLRCAAIVALVTAFARPLLRDRGGPADGFLGAREVVILLDRSYSMGYGDRWDQAVQAARSTIGELGPEDRATLVTFDSDAEAITEATGDATALRAALDAVTLGAGTTSYGPALELARRLLAGSDQPRREVVLITDFQRIGWDGDANARLPRGTALTRIDLSSPDPSNVAVTRVTLDRDAGGVGHRVAVTARIANEGSRTLEGLEVDLEIGGEEIARRTVEVEPNSSEAVEFEAVALPSRFVPGRVQVRRDQLATDDVFHFVVAPEPTLSVLIVEPPGARSTQSLYLRQALDVGGRPGFAVDLKRSRRVGAQDLEGRAVVILNDVPIADRGSIDRIRAFVQGGGGLFVVLGQRSPGGAWDDAAGFLPLPSGRPVDRSSDRGAILGYLDFDHPVFRIFGTPRSGDFSSSRFFRYHALSETPDLGVLARFDDGTPALVERRVGDGRILVWTSGLDNYWNDLAIQPVFLPFVQQAATWLADYVEHPAWHRVGQVIDLTRYRDIEAGDASAGELVVEEPSGRRSVLESEDGHLLPVREPGLYRLAHVGVPEDEVVAIAVNVDVTESDLAALDPEELAAAVVPGDPNAATAAGSGTLSLEERERNQGLWWYLLMGVAALLVLETAISNRRSAGVLRTTSR